MDSIIALKMRLEFVRTAGEPGNEVPTPSPIWMLVVCKCVVVELIAPVVLSLGGHNAPSPDEHGDDEEQSRVPWCQRPRD